jgi:hypothetical protein
MSEPTPVPESDAIHREMATLNAGSPRHTELAAQLEAAYRRAYPPGPSTENADLGPAPAQGPPSTEDIAARLAALPDPQSPEAVVASAFPDFAAPDGYALDTEAVVALRGMELSHDVPVSELTAISREYKAAWDRRGDPSDARLDQRDAALLAAWGDDYELELTRATEMAQRIPKRVLDHALQAGMHYDPVLWLKLAELWTRTHSR